MIVVIMQLYVFVIQLYTKEDEIYCMLINCSSVNLIFLKSNIFSFIPMSENYIFSLSLSFLIQAIASFLNYT